MMRMGLDGNVLDWARARVLSNGVASAAAPVPSHVVTAGGPASHCHSLHPRWGALEEVDEMPEGLRVAFLEPRFREKEIAVDGPCEDWHWVLGAQVKGEVPDLQAPGSGGRQGL
jgi:hypothetical protein